MDVRQLFNSTKMFCAPFLPQLGSRCLARQREEGAGGRDNGWDVFFAFLLFIHFAALLFSNQETGVVVLNLFFIQVECM